MTVPPLLDELLRAHGASGYEDAVQAIVRREAAAIGAEIETDVLGSTIATVRGTTGGRTLALFAHADQVGMAVRDVGEDGLLTVAKLANWPAARTRSGSAFGSTTRDGEVRGVVVAPRDGEPSWEALRVDIGASGREDALALVRPGDAIVVDGPPELLPNGRVLSGCLDDRVGIFVGLEVLAADRGRTPAWDVALVVSVQEETGTHGGARLVAGALAPDVAIVVEVTYAGDAPGDRRPGATCGSAAARPSSGGRSSARSSATACSRPRRRPGSRWRSSPARRPPATPTTSSRPALALPAGSSASHCATCTPPARSSSSPTSTPRRG